MSTEHRQASNQIIPVFGSHEISSEALFDFREQVDGQGTIPKTWIWPESTISRVQKLNPGLLAIDGLNPQVATNRIIFFSPGNPLDLQPCVFVGADLPVGRYIDKYRGYSPRKEDIFETAMRKYWNASAGGSIDDPNQEYITTRISALMTQALPELVALFGITYAISIASEGAGYDSNLLQRIILYGEAARILASRSVMRRVASFVDYKSFIILCRLTRPLLMKTEDIEVRNAVTAIKLTGIRSLDASLDQGRPSVALFGSNHGNGSNLWNNPDRQHQIMEKAVEKAVTAIEREAYKKSTKNPRSFKRDAESTLNEFFARTTLWRFNRVTGAETIRSINRSLVRKDFYDPVIKEIVSKAARNL